MLKKIAITFGSKVFVAITNLLSVVLISRYLGAEGKGQTSLIITGIAMVLLFSNMLGGATLVYFVPRYNLRKLLIVSYSWSFFVCLVCLFLFQSLNLVSPAILYHVTVLSFVNALVSHHLSILIGQERILEHNQVSFLQAFFNFSILGLLLYFHSEIGINAYLIALYASFLLSFLLSFYHVLKGKKLIFEGDFRTISSQMLKIGASNQLGHILKFTSFRLTYYLLAIISGEAAVGIFSNGVSLVESALIITNSFAIVLYSKVSNSTNDAANIKLTLNVLKVSFLLCVLALLPMVLLPDAFYVWLFGSEFAEVSKTILILAPGIAIYNVSLIVGHYFSGKGNYIIPSLANLAGLIATLLMLLIYLPEFTITQIAMLSTVSYFATTGFMLTAFIIKTKIPLFQLLPDSSDMDYLRKRLKFRVS
jgi:O-antigen/teichoic acid export membrane protein